MEYVIANTRLENLLGRDKCYDMERMCEVLKGEIAPVIENFITTAHPINVRFRKEGERMLFSVEIEALRVKPFGYMP